MVTGPGGEEVTGHKRKGCRSNLPQIYFVWFLFGGKKNQISDILEGPHSCLATLSTTEHRLLLQLTTSRIIHIASFKPRPGVRDYLLTAQIN